MPAKMSSDLENLRVTSGALTFGIDHPSVRAVVNESLGHELAMSFTYVGITEQLKPLSSGQLRYQIGIKLRALDGDNVIYAMWRWEPGESSLAWVTTKIGGTYIPPASTDYTADVPEPVSGNRYTIRARQDNTVVRMWWQDALVWVGDITEEAAMTFDGPVGIRTDNAAISNISLRYHVP